MVYSCPWDGTSQGLFCPAGSSGPVVPTGITYAAAKRKANSWLLNEVGNLLLADDGELAQSGGRWVWRFGIYLTAPSYEPRGSHFAHSSRTSSALAFSQRSWPKISSVIVPS